MEKMSSHFQWDIFSIYFYLPTFTYRRLLEVLTFSSPSLRGLDMEMEAPVHTVPASAVRL